MRRETKFPILSWTSSGSTITVGHNPSNSESYTAITLNDGKRRYFTSAIEIDPSNQGDAGADITAVTTGRWKRVYLIPKSGDDDQLSACVSDQWLDVGPYLGDGSTNPHSAWRYLGTVYLESGPTFRQFAQVGNKFYIINLDDMYHYINSSGLNTATWHNLQFITGVDGGLPSNCVGEAHVGLAWVTSTSDTESYGAWHVLMATSTPPTPDTTVGVVDPTFNFRAYVGDSRVNTYMQHGSALDKFWVPVDSDSDKLYYYHRDTNNDAQNFGGGEVCITVNAWRDKYIPFY